MKGIKAGEKIIIKALRYDGTPYRWWNATLQKVSPNEYVTFVPLGQTFYEPENNWTSNVYTQSYYWTDLSFNVTEAYSEEGNPVWLYANIASPINVEKGSLTYRDFELDLYYPVGGTLEVLDEDEFQHAIKQHGYSDVFIQQCLSSLEAEKSVSSELEIPRTYEVLSER